jgi:transcription termination/antitermination protein NusG
MRALELPLFPGYMFCRFDGQNRLPILLVPGVLSIVEIASPAAVSDEEILSLQKVAASGLNYGPWPFDQAHHDIVVERGPLAGLKGKVLRIKSDLRLVLSVQLLQRSVCVEIDEDCVKSRRTRPIAQNDRSWLTLSKDSKEEK